jgi:hypothetical protein
MISRPNEHEMIVITLNPTDTGIDDLVKAARDHRPPLLVCVITDDGKAASLPQNIRDMDPETCALSSLPDHLNDRAGGAAAKR